MTTLTYIDLLDRAARFVGDKPALTDDQVSLLQVEQVLNRHPAVQDCAVIGVPDEKWGEAVKAVVELVPGKSVTADALMAMCKAELGSVMAPKSVDFIDALPRSPVGKVLKRTLREPYWTQRQGRI